MAFEKVEKEILTKELILLDIRDAAKRYTPKTKFPTESFVTLLGALIAIATAFLTAKPAFLLLFFVIPLPVVLVIELKKRKQTQALTADDITVETDTAVSVEERTIPRGKTYEIALILHFDGSGEWEIPSENYRWSRTYRMSSSGVDHTTLCGDHFWIVRRRDSGEVLIAYNQKFFGYDKE